MILELSTPAVVKKQPTVQTKSTEYSHPGKLEMLGQNVSHREEQESETQFIFFSKFSQKDGLNHYIWSLLRGFRVSRSSYLFFIILVNYS